MILPGIWNYVTIEKGKLFRKDRTQSQVSKVLETMIDWLPNMKIYDYLAISND